MGVRRHKDMEELGRIVEAAGLSWFDHGRGHFQILGGPRIVNYYPNAKKGPTIYIQGMAGSSTGDIHAAIRLAQTGFDGRVQRRHERHDSERERRWGLWRRQEGKCHWCHDPVPFNDSTLDHVVPLGKGGGQGNDNVVMACSPCNKTRKDNIRTEELWTLSQPKPEPQEVPTPVSTTIYRRTWPGRADASPEVLAQCPFEVGWDFQKTGPFSVIQPGSAAV